MNEIIINVGFVILAPFVVVATIVYGIYARLTEREKVEKKLSRMYLPQRDKDRLRELPPNQALRELKQLKDWTDTLRL